MAKMHQNGMYQEAHEKKYSRVDEGREFGACGGFVCPAVWLVPKQYY